MATCLRAGTHWAAAAVASVWDEQRQIQCMQAYGKVWKDGVITSTWRGSHHCTSTCKDAGQPVCENQPIKAQVKAMFWARSADSKPAEPASLEIRTRARVR